MITETKNSQPILLVSVRFNRNLVLNILNKISISGKKFTLAFQKNIDIIPTYD